VNLHEGVVLGVERGGGAADVLPEGRLPACSRGLEPTGLARAPDQLYDSSRDVRAKMLDQLAGSGPTL
jgi:hypothetical protein